MNRKDLVLQQKNKITQKLPEDLEKKITNFPRYVILESNKTTNNNREVILMKPLFFICFVIQLFIQKVKKCIQIKSTGHKKN